MLRKVPSVALLVGDQDKAPDFYTNVIGFEKRSGRWLIAHEHISLPLGWLNDE